MDQGPRRGAILPYLFREKKIVLNVFNYLRTLFRNKGLLYVIQQTSKATGFSKKFLHTVCKVSQNQERHLARKRTANRNKNLSFNDNVVQSIRNIIDSLKKRGITVSVSNIWKHIRDDPTLPKLDKATLRTLMFEMGFNYRKVKPTLSGKILPGHSSTKNKNLNRKSILVKNCIKNNKDFDDSSSDSAEDSENMRVDIETPCSSSDINRCVNETINRLQEQGFSPNMKTISDYIKADPSLPNLDESNLRKAVFDLGFYYKKRGRKPILVNKNSCNENGEDFDNSVKLSEELESTRVKNELDDGNGSSNSEIKQYVNEIIDRLQEEGVSLNMKSISDYIKADPSLPDLDESNLRKAVFDLGFYFKKRGRKPILVNKNSFNNCDDSSLDVKQRLTDVINQLQEQQASPNIGTISKHIKADPSLRHLKGPILRKAVFDLGFYYKKRGRKPILVNKNSCNENGGDSDNSVDLAEELENVSVNNDLDDGSGSSSSEIKQYVTDIINRLQKDGVSFNIKTILDYMKADPNLPDLDESSLQKAVYDLGFYFKEIGKKPGLDNSNQVKENCSNSDISSSEHMDLPEELENTSVDNDSTSNSYDFKQIVNEVINQLQEQGVSLNIQTISDYIRADPWFPEFDEPDLRKAVFDLGFYFKKRGRKPLLVNKNAIEANGNDSDDSSRELAGGSSSSDIKRRLKDVINRFQEQGASPNVATISKRIKADPSLRHLKGPSLRKTVRELGFHFEKRGRNKFLVEKNTIDNEDSDNSFCEDTSSSEIKQVVEHAINRLQGQGVNPNMRTILEYIKADPSFPDYKESYLRRAVSDLGFYFKKRGRKPILVNRWQDSGSIEDIKENVKMKDVSSDVENKILEPEQTLFDNEPDFKLLEISGDDASAAQLQALLTLVDKNVTIKTEMELDDGEDSLNAEVSNRITEVKTDKITEVECDYENWSVKIKTEINEDSCESQILDAEPQTTENEPISNKDSAVCENSHRIINEEIQIKTEFELPESEDEFQVSNPEAEESESYSPFSMLNYPVEATNGIKVEIEEEDIFDE